MTLISSSSVRSVEQNIYICTNYIPFENICKRNNIQDFLVVFKYLIFYTTKCSKNFTEPCSNPNYCEKRTQFLIFSAFGLKTTSEPSLYLQTHIIVAKMTFVGLCDSML